MENYDPRRRSSGDDERRNRPHNEERGRDSESWRESMRDQERHARSGRGWLEYERDGGRDDRYAARDERHGERGGSDDRARHGAPWRGRDERGWEERARESIPPEQRHLAERSGRGEYYSPDWPYERGDRARDSRRSRDDEQQSHYRGYYRSASAPFSYPGGSGMLYSESLTLHGPYAGRGPKGYKRSDQQIVEEACQRLERDGDIDASEIEVTAEDGVIRLRGTVQDRRTKRHAEACVESVYGARDVMNELRVAAPSSGESQASQASQRSQSGRGTPSQPQQSADDKLLPH
jgi:hypothetical protein